MPVSFEAGFFIDPMLNFNQIARNELVRYPSETEESRRPYSQLVKNIP